MTQNKQQEPPQHRCYRGNWGGSSAAMESDILVEGFRSSEQAHGICYMRVIGDGDSSLMADLQQSVAYRKQGSLLKLSVPITFAKL